MMEGGGAYLSRPSNTSVRNTQCAPQARAPGVVSKVLALRQNDKVANRDMPRARQHEKKRVNDVVITQAAMRRDPTLDLMPIGQAPKLVQDHPRRQRAYAHIMLGDLPAHAMNERLHRMLGRRIDGLPVDRLMA